MRLVFLYGAPATGKYTVGRELAALTRFELYHNHLVVDDVLRRHAFGTPGFIAERDDAWREHLGAAARRKEGGLIFTFNPENSVPQGFIDWLFADLPRETGSTLFSVELVAPESEIEARLASEQRQGFKKLTDLELHRRLREDGVFQTPVIPRTDLWINTVGLPPGEAARQISERLSLP
ncbi:hypothetical protein DFJ74DRAFT_296421 [Hyaloraphidium curvatum]|nr:hypothetical protein DFJ74DRAFT_296421 [Hyaloraphidium curvatum]